MKRSILLSAGAVAAAATLLVGGSPLASAGGGSRFVAAGLKGANEVAPVVGDLDSAGFAFIELDRSEKKVCVRDAAFGGTTKGILFHIHSGPAGINGPVVVDFTANLPSGIGCGVIMSDDPKLVNKIRRNPDQFYVNYHSVGFEGGAMRGQLVSVNP